jgi:hypothetical protein
MAVSRNPRQKQSANVNTVSEVKAELTKKGNLQTRTIYARHGAPESMFGVKVSELKAIARKTPAD